MILANPTANLRRSQLWGFEVTHTLGAFGAMTAANFICTSFHLPISLSWGVGIGTLAGLRILSIGKKAGHLGFLVQWLVEPHIYLGLQLYRPQTENLND
ncbi:MAG: hypothetical protein JST16_01100 [Bdellovibrionales bacterium]|nr:hypothetical protein [Bdellovibrionales bacterium]